MSRSVRLLAAALIVSPIMVAEAEAREVALQVRMTSSPLQILSARAQTNGEPTVIVVGDYEMTFRIDPTRTAEAVRRYLVRIEVRLPSENGRAVINAPVLLVERGTWNPTTFPHRRGVRTTVQVMVR